MVQVIIVDISFVKPSFFFCFASDKVQHFRFLSFHNSLLYLLECVSHYY